MRRWIAASLGAALTLASPMLLAASLSVVFINPGRTDEPFWRSVVRFMLPAAQQLDVRLEVLHAERDHLKMIDLTKQICERSRKPDYLMIVNEKLAAGEMLKIADNAGIKTLVLFSAFDEQQRAEFGTPRKKYKNWLGSFAPNAVDAGRITARELVQEAFARRIVADDGKVHIAVIAGDKSTPTGKQRLQGALDVLSADSSVVVEQVVYGNYEKSRAQEQAAALLLRYPKLNAFWAGSDLMAFGAMEAAEAAGRKPGTDLLFSAINNSPQVLQARAQGQLASLAGGHFTSGAWGLVLLYDYHHGKDFRHEGLVMDVPIFMSIDAERAQRFLTRFGDEDFSSVDFRQFSKRLNPHLRTYQFGLLQALK